MTGFLLGISTAITWGVGNVLTKSQLGKLDTKQLLAVRAIAGMIISFLAYFLLVNNPALAQLKSWDWLAIIGSVLTGYFGAELLFILALEDLPLSYVFPIQASYPLIATGLAWLIFGDAITTWMLLGAVIIITGVSLIGSDDPQQKGPTNPEKKLQGFIFSTISAVGWGVSAVLLRFVLEVHDPITVNAGVSFLTALFFFLIVNPAHTTRNFVANPRIISAICVAGVIGGTGLSNLLFIVAIQYAGVAIATVLASTAPLFTSLLAIIFLNEKLTVRLSMGTFLTVIGVGILVGG